MPSKKFIDKTIPIPMFYQLKQILLTDIRNGVYKTGDMIPTEAELSIMYDISRSTVRQAILELVHEGYLNRAKGKGTFVAEDKLMHNFIQKIESFQDEMQRLGVTPSTEVIALECINASTEISSILQIPKGDKIIFLHRKRLVNNEPVVLIETYLPFEKCKFILDYNLEKEALYKLLSQNSETVICKVERTIEASIANKYDARLLQVYKGQAIHYFKTKGFAKDNSIIEYSQARYRGDRSSFQISIRIEPTN
ncbi:GntR family transcriptional regulator [Candidatus Epulonipiscium fishelsonii]|uniref:GntR family transcriptional regulator n=1 Tax=Candidatus Epulonipiscium fishelsonii TaxID=77094 RepID=A0ACC8XHC7_9FIRM|nr:GntR family transcriptional regulator [Epulopiscium sp. SCG-B11WGA-EpuloA1]